MSWQNRGQLSNGETAIDGGQRWGGSRAAESRGRRPSARPEIEASPFELSWFNQPRRDRGKSGQQTTSQPSTVPCVGGPARRSRHWSVRHLFDWPPSREGSTGAGALVIATPIAEEMAAGSHIKRARMRREAQRCTAANSLRRREMLVLELEGGRSHTGEKTPVRENPAV